MRIILRVACLAAGVLLPCSAPAQPLAAPQEFRIDAGHSLVTFSIPFMGFPVRGRFDDIKGTIIHAPGAKGSPGKSSVSVAIGSKSVNTGSQHRDEHLRSDDFFDAVTYPTILFQSSAITQRGDKLLMTGSLSMHGVTRQIVIPFRSRGAPIEDPHGSTLVYFDGGVRIARKDFGMLGGDKHNDWFDKARSATMGDTVDVTLEIAGWRKR